MPRQAASIGPYPGPFQPQSKLRSVSSLQISSIIRLDLHAQTTVTLEVSHTVYLHKTPSNFSPLLTELVGLQSEPASSILKSLLWLWKPRIRLPLFDLSFWFQDQTCKVSTPTGASQDCRYCFLPLRIYSDWGLTMVSYLANFPDN